MNRQSMFSAYATVLKRDLLLAMRRRAELVNPLLFFIIVITLFPLAIGADQQQLQAIAPGIIWVAALLAALLSLDSIFRSDFEDGSLEQLLMSAYPVSLLVLAKVTAHWLVTGLPLIFVAPLLGVLLGLPGKAMDVLMITLLLGTPILSLVGAIGVALTVGLRRGGIILSLLVLPLYIPVLIFASIPVQMAVDGLPSNAHLLMLGAILVFAVTLAPLPTAAALRLSLS